MEKFESERNVRFDFGQNIMPEPPHEILQYIRQKDDGDWELINKSIENEYIDIFNNWHQYFLDYAEWQNDKRKKCITEEQMEKIKNIESFLIGDDVFPYPPDYIFDYTQQNFRGDWVLKNGNESEYIRKEFDKWHNYFLENAICILDSSSNFLRKSEIYNEYDKIWNERTSAFFDIIETCKYPESYSYDMYLGMIIPIKPLESMNNDELEDFIKYAKKSRENWKNIVNKQEIKKRITPNFRKENIKKIRKEYDVPKDISNEELNELVENVILEAENILSKRKI
jgi:hypothetical protein